MIACQKMIWGQFAETKSAASWNLLRFNLLIILLIVSYFTSSKITNIEFQPFTSIWYKYATIQLFYSKYSYPKVEFKDTIFVLMRNNRYVYE